ncbi:hypothetical protein UB46_34490 [Burkholderiaceae bacterium 16]|nr:hypothetical protein UB46_34490 [Burkholderiaceae bacterium 16]
MTQSYAFRTLTLILTDDALERFSEASDAVTKPTIAGRRTTGVMTKAKQELVEVLMRPEGRR